MPPGAALADQPLTRRDVRVGSTSRIYWIADGAPAAAPLLVVLRGSGVSPAVMAFWTGLATRGPAAGLATVFPEGWRQAWDDVGLERVDGAQTMASSSAPW